MAGSEGATKQAEFDFGGGIWQRDGARLFLYDGHSCPSMRTVHGNVGQECPAYSAVWSLPDDCVNCS